MALNIKDPETDRIARELSAATGESITVAVRVAMEERLRRVRGATVTDADDAVIREIIERARRRGVLDTRTDDEILGFDAAGIPT